MMASVPTISSSPSTVVMPTVSAPAGTLTPTAVIGQVTADLKAAVAVYTSKTPISLASIGPMVVELYDDLESYVTLTSSDKVTVLTTVLSTAIMASGLPAPEVELLTTVLTQVMPGILTSMDNILADVKTELTTCCTKMMKMFHC